MNLTIEIFQNSSYFELKRNYEIEKDDLKKIVGKSCNELFSFYQKSSKSSNQNILKASENIDLRITFSNSIILDTRDKKYDAFRQTFRFSSTSLSKRNFAKNLIFAHSLVIESDQENDIELNINPKIYKEGKVSKVTTNNYERSLKARQICLNYHGYKCKACNFDFFESYGELGLNYIQVHHITPVSEIKKTYAVNPIQDLIPLCANCHAMVHRKKETLTIEELKSKLTKANN